MRLTFNQTTDEKGNTWTHYYLVLENGNYIQIRPAFSKDYSKLRVLATKEEK